MQRSQIATSYVTSPPRNYRSLFFFFFFYFLPSRFFVVSLTYSPARNQVIPLVIPQKRKEKIKVARKRCARKIEPNKDPSFVSHLAKFIIFSFFFFRDPSDVSLRFGLHGKRLLLESGGLLLQRRLRSLQKSQQVPLLERYQHTPFPR